MKLNKDNYVIGITGGVGAGKSSVMDIIRNESQAKVYFADMVSMHITSTRGHIQDRLHAMFGEDCFDIDGLLSRKRVAEIVFRDPARLQELNDLVHPLVRAYLRKQAETESGLLIMEAALPVEAGFPEICDEIWYIHADMDVRIARLMKDRGYSEEKCRAVIDKQLSDEAFRSLCGRIIDNSRDVDYLRSQIVSALSDVTDRTGDRR